MTNYGDQFMKCMECGLTAEADAVDVGVGLYISDEYICDCGWNSAAEGMVRVGCYDDWFPEPSESSYKFDNSSAFRIAASSKSGLIAEPLVMTSQVECGAGFGPKLTRTHSPLGSTAS